MNASKDFISYLVRTGDLAPGDVPEDTRAPVVKSEENDIQGQDSLPQQQQRPVFQVCLSFTMFSTKFILYYNNVLI